jgi:hypothetical protein
MCLSSSVENLSIVCLKVILDLSPTDKQAVYKLEICG